MLCLFLLFGRFKRSLQNTYPSTKRLSRIPLCRITVRLLWGFAQISLALLCILLKLNFLDIIHVAYVVVGAGVVGALVYHNSIKYRCITNLMTMLFLGRSGRALLITLLLTMIISGVVHNLWSNSVEMVRVFVCTTAIHIRLTKMKFELLTTPFLKQFHSAVDSRKQLREEVERMTAFIHPAIEAVENPDPGFTPDNITRVTEPKDPQNVNALQYAEDYRKKLHGQCLYQIKETQRVCYEKFSHLYLECVERVVLVQTYCQSFKVEHYCSVSKIVSGSTPELFCDPTGVVPGQMGEAYRKLIENRQALEAARKGGKVSFNVTDLPTLPGIEDMKRTSENIKTHLQKKRKFIEGLLFLLSLFDVLIFIHLVHKTTTYYQHYVTDIDFDNIYLSDELRQIDKGRVDGGLPAILPLKHAEKDFYVDPMRKQLRRSEWFNISYNLMYICLIVVGVSGLFLLDWMYYTGLDVVNQNALVNFTQSGSFNFTLTVNGSGLLARIIRKATTGLNVTEFQALDETNGECLPNPTLTDWRSWVHVYAVAVLLLYVNVNLMYSQRMMSVVCGHFFPKKHQMRIKYLYNQMLIRRRIYFEEGLLNLLGQHIVGVAHTRSGRRSSKNRQIPTRFQSSGRSWETLLRWMKAKGQRVVEKLAVLRGSAVVQCAVCLEKEHITVTGTFTGCGFDGCELRYCNSCWTNLNRRCAVYYATEQKHIRNNQLEKIGQPSNK